MRLDGEHFSAGGRKINQASPSPLVARSAQREEAEEGRRPMTQRPAGMPMSLRADTVQALLGEAGTARESTSPSAQAALGHAVKGVAAVVLVMVSTPFAVAIV